MGRMEKYINIHIKNDYVTIINKRSFTMNELNNQHTLPEDKILILYILKKVGKPISYKELLDLIIAVSEINYFYFQQFLSDLLEDNYVIKTTNNEFELYELTTEGAEALELTLDLIPGIIKLKIDNNFQKSFNSIKDKFSISAEYDPVTNKVICKIIENHEDTFKIEISVNSQEQASIIINNWNTDANIIYPKLLETLTNKQTINQ